MTEIYYYCILNCTSQGTFIFTCVQFGCAAFYLTKNKNAMFCSTLIVIFLFDCILKDWLNW